MSSNFDLLAPTPEHQDYDPANDHSAQQARQRLDGRVLPDFGTSPEKEAPYYQVDKRLRTAINMALNTGSPLLLTGEPGTGKTMVAHYLAWYFGLPDPFVYVVRSDSEAEDLKYGFDTVAYLRDANDRNAPKLPRDDPAYFTKHALWRAYRYSSETGPCVLLIDEIDKAPRDFPNDLLLELERHRFPHPFKPGKENDIKANPGCPPIVVITSNAERRLPNAFLRRCIYHHIRLDRELLEKAIDAHRNKDQGGLRMDDDCVRAALDQVEKLRRYSPELAKKPSTAEVLVWLTLLSAQGTDPAKLTPTRLADLPLLTALIKDREDLDLLARG